MYYTYVDERTGTACLYLDLNAMSKSEVLSRINTLRGDISAWYQDNARRCVREKMTEQAFMELETKVRLSPIDNNVLWERIYDTLNLIET